MSENLNRSTEGFSKYDSMSIGELEEILRADAMGPERDDSDVDEILYVMEVLAKKRRQNGIAGKTALEAYQEFQQHYLPMDKEEPKRKSNIIPFRRIAAVAASIVLVFSLATSANAFSFRDVWNAVVTWAQETFSFSMGVEVSEPKATNELMFDSLQAALTDDNLPSDMVPMWIPNEFVLSEVVVDRNPMQDTYLAIYDNEYTRLKICIQSFLSNCPEQIEASGDLLEIYSNHGIDYHIFKNRQVIQAVWLTDTFECYISGEISIENVKLMIDSIAEGIAND